MTSGRGSGDAESAVARIGEGVLKVLVGGGVLSLALLAPNVISALDKPLRNYLKKLDVRDRDRELKRALYYVKRQGWISAPGRGYEYGMRITEEGLRRLRAVELDNLAILTPQHWDKKWRIVFYDIPEQYKTGRSALIYRLKILGFYPLQRSVLVHPFPCRQEVATIAAVYNIERFVSYIETDHIDQQDLLLRKFPNILK